MANINNPNDFRHTHNDKMMLEVPVAHAVISNF